MWEKLATMLGLNRKDEQDRPDNAKDPAGATPRDPDANRGFFARVWYGTAAACKVFYKWLPWFRDYRVHETVPFRRAEGVKRREAVRLALVEIRKAGFYTEDGLVSLAQAHYAKLRDDLIEQAKNPELTREEREDLLEQSRERALDVRCLRHMSMDDRLANELRELGLQENEDSYRERPRGKRLRLIYDYFKDSGFLKHPLPVNRLAEKPDALRNLVYKTEKNGDMLYYALRKAVGEHDPVMLMPVEEKEEEHPYPGAIYRSYIFDEPFFKRGLFIMRGGDKKGPVDVEYYEGWTIEHQTGRFLKDEKTGEFILDARNRRIPITAPQKYEEYYRGYLIDQGFDSYVFLFGPQKPAFDARNIEAAKIAFEGLNRVMSQFSAVLAKTKNNIPAFLHEVGEEKVLDCIEDLVKQQEKQKRLEKQAQSASLQHIGGGHHHAGQAAIAFSDGTEAGQQIPRAFTPSNEVASYDELEDDELSGFEIAGGRELVDHPLVRKFSSTFYQNKRAAEAVSSHISAQRAQEALWKIFEVDGKPAPKAGKSLRVRTLYLKGASKDNLTPNSLRGTVQAFNPSGKGDVISERMLFRRMGDPRECNIEMSLVSIAARDTMGSFDVRVPENNDGMRLKDFEPDYRSIFLELGYDAYPADEEGKAMRIDPIVNRTGSDPDEYEFIVGGNE